MTHWKYTDSSNQVVTRLTDNGAQESCLVEVIQEWIDLGNTPDPADLTVPEPPTATPDQLRAALASLGMGESALNALFTAAAKL